MNLFNNRRRFLGASMAAASGVAVAGTGLIASAQASAAQPGGNVKEPAVIGYPNTKGVQIERVTYPARNMGTSIIANVFKPAGFDQRKTYAAIVVTHPFGGVKEQTAGLYAMHLAEQGFVTLAYDASYQGESGGEPRLMEVPAQRLDDISCAIDFLAQQAYVDAARIGSLGICAGGSYAMGNAQTELRVKAIATVSMFNLGDARRNAMGLLSYEERIKRLKDASEQRSKEARGEPVRLVPVVPESAAEFTDKTPDLYRQGHEYYVTARAKHPNSPNRYAFSSLPLQMAFFPFDQVETISPRPILMIAGELADTKFWSDEVLAKAQEPKELFVVKGATHMDMYDKPQFVVPATAKLTSFYRQYL
ncbi:alpha/beta hydrolase [Pigmentiphaga aceris]|uniref:Alpha/beta hydrolase n=1 Tax=Pigmentiphaga aceris TaxID=1940612 RepID=A0A5C0AZ88_9BURK|nr:alpha/beta hydrolase [Pigmentiphaga aceris]QEI06170.1 alpha/beta hydrolase [Pigmentiphaga aceris]